MVALLLAGCAFDRMFAAPPELTAPVPQRNEPLLAGVTPAHKPAPEPPLLLSAPTASAAASPSVAPLVLLYASPVTQAYFARAGIDDKSAVQAWEHFLRKYKIPFMTTASVEALERSAAPVLLLPSAVALSEREMQAVVAFRANGGGVLSTWQTGVFNEKGEARGYAFMESALDVKVAGSTEADENDSFLIPSGDNPVSHYLPAGLRVWTERVKGWYPLRLAGQHTAARIMDWSRSAPEGKVTGGIVFGERGAPAQKASRAVAFGFPERLWTSADAKAIESLAHNALTWLLRIPDAYLAAWPHPYGSATVLAIDLADTPGDTDLDTARLVGDLGGKASFFVLSEHAAGSADLLKKIPAQGHELGHLGDRFDGFKNQPPAVQVKRIDTMLAEMKAAGLDFASAGFHPPMESHDQATERALQERGFDYVIGGMDASEARLPTPSSGAAAGGAPGPLLILPRTQNGPEDWLAEGDAAAGMKNFFQESDIAERMGGLSILRIPGVTMLTGPQLAEIGAWLKQRRERMWLASAAQVAGWWRAREAIEASVDTGVAPPLLTVRIAAGAKLPRAAAVWVNLPEAGSRLRLAADGGTRLLPRTGQVDAWRDAVVLDGLPPGEYRWQLFFDRAATR